MMLLYDHCLSNMKNTNAAPLKSRWAPSHSRSTHEKLRNFSEVQIKEWADKYRSIFDLQYFANEKTLLNTYYNVGVTHTLPDNEIARRQAILAVTIAAFGITPFMMERLAVSDSTLAHFKHGKLTAPKLHILNRDRVIQILNLTPDEAMRIPKAPVFNIHGVDVGTSGTYHAYIQHDSGELSKIWHLEKLISAGAVAIVLGYIGYKFNHNIIGCSSFDVTPMQAREFLSWAQEVKIYIPGINIPSTCFANSGCSVRQTLDAIECLPEAAEDEFSKQALLDILLAREVKIKDYIETNSKFIKMHPLLRESLYMVAKSLARKQESINELREFIISGKLPDSVELV